MSWGLTILRDWQGRIITHVRLPGERLPLCQTLEIHPPLVSPGETPVCMICRDIQHHRDRLGLDVVADPTERERLMRDTEPA